MPQTRPPQSAASYDYDRGPEATRSAARSSAHIVPMLCEALRPSSVVDYGCGLGDWLHAFVSCGVEDILGLDGAWVPPEKLVIPAERFRAVDFTGPIRLERRFDLAVCLEVAEHFGDAFADALVDSLTSCADMVCFSAAVPGQGGYGHVNEQFQDYWVEKFRIRGYRPVDLVRPRIWWNAEIAFWYRQNLLLFLNEAALRRTALAETAGVFSCIHPELYNQKRDARNQSLRSIIGLIPFYVRRAIMARLPK